MAGTRTGGDAFRNDIDVTGSGDGFGAFRDALRSTQMAGEASDQPGVEAVEQDIVEQSLDAASRGEIDAGDPVGASGIVSVAASGFLIEGGNSFGGLAASRAADFTLDIDTSNFGKLQYGLADLFVESQRSVAGLTAEERNAALADFTSANTGARIHNGMVAIDVVASDGDGAALLAKLQGLGLQYGASFKGMAGGMIPLDALDELAALDGVAFARPVYMESHVGTVTQQPVQSMNVDLARAAHSASLGDGNLDGSGITIGILSDSFNTRLNPLTNYAQDIVSGDLPAGINVLLDMTPGTGSDEGRAMAQGIYDIAPGVGMAFHSAFISETSFAAGIVRLSEPVIDGGGGARIIVDDVRYFNEPFFQDGIIAQAVDQAVANGAMYFASGGNQHTASWEGAFVDSGSMIQITSANPLTAGFFRLHDFNPGAAIDTIQNFTKSGTVTFTLNWDQPSLSAGGAGSQSDLVMIFYNGANPIGAVTSNNIGFDAIEIAQFSQAATGIAIGVRDGNPLPGLMKYVVNGSVSISEYHTRSGTSFGHSNAEGAISVGASDWADSPRELAGGPYIAGEPFPYAENFSSKGGVPILFDGAGNRLASPILRTTVDLTASDGGNTTFFGSDVNYDADTFPNFFGTSQAAPNAAAVAALLMELFPAATNAQIESALKLSSLDIRVNWQAGTNPANFGLAPGYDLTSGTGLIQADRAVTALATLLADPNTAPVVSATDTTAAVTELVTPVGNLTDTGIITFTDADGAELHTVTNGFPVGFAIGSLTATLTQDTDAGGNGGQISWTYTVPASATEYLAAGETKVDTFGIVLDDTHGSMATIYVTATVTGTNDAPFFAFVATAPSDRIAATIAETNSTLAATGTVTVIDPDITDLVTPTVESVAATGAVTGLTSDNAALLAMMSVGPATLTADTGSVHNLGWSFNSGAQAFNYLSVGQSLVLTYTLRATDDNAVPASATQTVTVTITGANDAPVISLVTTDSAAATVTETNAALSATGTLTVTDADIADTVTPTVLSVAAGGTTAGLVPNNAALQAMLSLVPATPLGADPGSEHNLSWNFNSSPEAFDYLQQGESLTLTYVVQAADGNGGTTTQNVTITVNGTADAPVISVVTTDNATPALIETNATLSTNGTLTVVDADMSDSVTPSVVSVVAGGTTAGLLSGNAALQAMLTVSPASIPANAGSTHNLAWSFNSAGQAFDYLDEGETLTLTYTVRATDTTGLSDDQTVTFTITGTNDAPTLGLVSPSDSASASLTDGANPLLAQGSLTAVDPDLSDSVTSSVVSVVGVPALGDPNVLSMLKLSPASLAANPGPASPANLNWSFLASGAAFDYLAAGETQTLTYTVRVTDDSGATANQNVVITVTGTNEAPTITSALPVSTAVVELADGAAGENAASLVQSGVIAFADTDLSDLHSVSVVANGAGYSGVFSTGAVNQAGNSLGWNFAVNDSALNWLAQGQVLTQSYTVTLSDGHGGTTSVVISVDLIGSNDAAILSADTVVVTQGLVPATAGGTLTISDEDNPALFQPLSGTPGSYGSLSLEADGDWSYVASQPYTNLAPGDVLTDAFTVYAVDGTPTTVTVLIAGSNDVAIARMDAFDTNEATVIGSGLSLFDDNGSGADTDPDSPLAISAVNGDPAFVGQWIALASGALLRVNADGTFSYNPNGAFNTLTLAPGAANQSAYDSFTYTLQGGSSATVFVNIAGLNGAGDELAGDLGNNVITGFNTGDMFDFGQGGSDTGYGLGGNDGFYFGAAFDGTDEVDGGDGSDTVALQGGARVAMGDVTGVEVLALLSGSDTRFGDSANNRYDYDVTTNDDNVGAGQTLTVSATGLLAGEDVVFDGSAETDGNFRIFAGQGNDDLTGGAGNDGFFFGADGNLNGADQVDGGAGTDTLAIRGDYVGFDAIVLGNASLSSVEVIAFLSGHTNEFGGPLTFAGFDYDLTTADGNVAAGQRLDVIATGLASDESLRFDGRAETDGSFRILAGAGSDTLWGGAGNDVIYGGGGRDQMNGGGGADTFVYLSAADSTSTGFDTITGFDWHVDRIDVPGGGGRTLGTSGSGSLSMASFDADLAAGLDGFLGAGQAALFSATSGTMAGRLFAVIDGNGVAGYQAGEDLVIELVSPVTPMDPNVGVIF